MRNKGLVLNIRQFEKFCTSLCDVVGSVTFSEKSDDVYFGEGNKYAIKYSPYKPDEIIDETPKSKTVVSHIGKIELVRRSDGLIIATCAKKKELDRFVTICQVVNTLDILQENK